MDLPWLKELADKNMIACLDEFFEENAEEMSIYTEDIMNKFSRINGHSYAVPYGFTVQLLFYRKDLFDKIKNQRLYYEWYREELRVPQSWEELNKVARLFTRKYNPDSETKYGVTLDVYKRQGDCRSCFSIILLQEFFPLSEIPGHRLSSLRFLPRPISW